VFCSAADLARYVAALLRMSAGEYGSVLKPETLVSMFSPHFQPDPRLPGMGLGFQLGEEHGHRTAGHTGIVSGFLSAMTVAPDDGIGVFALGNTGGLTGRGAPAPLAPALLRHALGLADPATRTGIPPRPDTWNGLCGWYSPDPGPVTNLFTRPLFGAGVEVTVHRGQLMLKPLTPVPAMRRGMPLHPGDPGDPQVFRAELPEFGISIPLVFSGGPAPGARASRLLLDLMSFRRRPDARNPRRWVTGVAAAGAVTVALRRRRCTRSTGAQPGS